MSRTALAFVLTFALPAQAETYDSLEALGEALFFDTNLSANRTQSCATCHDPAFAFVDPRETDAGRMVSLGDDGESLGDRNTPTASYAAFTPEFHQLDPGIYAGGFFYDGRAATLEDQAAGPPLNPLEMAMPDEASVVARLTENADYIAAFASLFAPGILSNPDAAFAAMTQAIAAFERTDLFQPFDSRYDRALRGEIELTELEQFGWHLFFRPHTNCNQCHQLRMPPNAPDETFSTYEYHNIGTPENLTARAVNGHKQIDRGLFQHPDVTEPETLGQFKVPTLRNIAVTGPYMHNGVFEDLRTVVLFYEKYVTTARDRQINPETGEPWRAPEVPATISTDILRQGRPLNDVQVDAIVAFLKTLTDARYEHLLED